MTTALAVLAPGLHTTVQDLGRVGWQAIGVPVSGALDTTALRLANRLVGNSPAAAGLEILHSGPTFEVTADRVRVALAGAAASLVINGAATVPAWQSVSLARGDVVAVVVGGAACCCLAVEGGVAVPRVLGSAATYVRAGIGGHMGRPLRAGDRVPLAIAKAPERPELRLPGPPPAAACSGSSPISASSAFDASSKRVQLIVLHPGSSVAEVQANTGFALLTAPEPPVTDAPAEHELQVLRRLDPDRLYAA